MIIDESRIEKKGIRVSDTYRPDDKLLLDGDSTFDEDLSFSVSLVRDGEKIKVTGSVKTAIILKCVRCLEDFSFRINSKFDAILYPLKHADFTHTALKEDDMEYIFYDDGKIDIEKLVMEQVNLNIPLRVLCSNSCKGLCSICGKNLNYGDCSCDRTVNEINIFNIKR